MAIEFERSLVGRRDTIANHGTQTSGNTVFLSLPAVRPTETPEDISSMPIEISDEIESFADNVYVKFKGRRPEEVREELFAALGTGSTGVGKTWLAKEIISKHLRTTALVRVIPKAQQVSTDIRTLVDRETDKLDVLSDGIGPALLSVLHTYGSLSIEEMLGSLDIANEMLISRLETLERTGLVMIEDGQYSITEEGIEFLSPLGLETENR